eukprot:Phypoly_transcript_04874.p1 GENE.Phypoly_transcript_04874~~Phypoly_transcript_04874.p1  ORF type:complete len:659 (-),score=127.26 Phypoly_transcript_04874:103-2049(-)
MEAQVKEILALEEGVSVSKKELVKEDAGKLLALAGGNAQPAELEYLLDTIDTLANAAAINRVAFAEAGVKPLVELLHNPSPEVITHALKAISTLAFDNQIKTSLLDLGIANLALDLVKSSDAALALRATELVGHICFSSEHVSASFLSAGALAALLPRATQTQDAALRYSAIRAIGSMSEKTANQNKVVAEGGMDFLLSALGNEASLQDATLLYEIIRALSVLVQQNPPNTKLIVTRGALKSLMNIVSKFYPISSAKASEISAEDKSKIDDAKSPDVVASDLLVAVADDDTLRLPFMEGGHVPEIVRLLELPAGNVKVVRNLLKVLARLSVNDTIMKDLIQYTTSILAVLKNEDVEVQLAAILVLGNLARTEENVTKLIGLGVVDTLLNFIKTSSTTNTPLTHVSVNCLRNFSISVQNKKKLGEGQVIPTLIYLLPHENPLVQFAAVVALKNLLQNCEPNVDVFLRDNGLPPLVKLANDKGVLSEAEGETEEEKLQNADKRIQYECTRILVKFAERAELLKQIITLKGIRPMIEMMGCEHEVLRIEGSRGLVCVASVDEYRPLIIQEAGGAEALVRLFEQHEDLAQIIQSNEDFQWNIAQIFNNLAKNDQSRTALLSAKVVPLLKTISRSSSPRCKPVFVETLSILTC